MLRMVGATLARAVRPDDIVGRLGGEEFLVILPAATAANAWGAAERLRKMVHTGWVDVAGRRVTITVSIGVAAVEPAETCKAVVMRADSAMLRAKQAGRNRTAMADGGDRPARLD